MTQTSAAAQSKRQRNTLGKASYDHIVGVAEQVLKSGGYHSFSTRRVADACGISAGNLTYHFPSKALLVEAVMAAVCNRYEAQRATAREHAFKDARTFLERTIRWMLDDAVDPETSALFVELWVMAKHHDFGAEILERFYVAGTDWLVKEFKTYFPHAKRKKRRRAAWFLLTLSEGSVAVFSRPHPRPVDQTEIVDFAVTGVLSILGTRDR